MRNRNLNKLRFKQEEVPAIIHEGWLRIASENFLDSTRYPDVPAKRADKKPASIPIFGTADDQHKVPGAFYDGTFRKNT